jgi:hypothetical protein
MQMENATTTELFETNETEQSDADLQILFEIFKSAALKMIQNGEINLDGQLDAA